ncbi:MAG: hypothetical protein AAF797_00890 [Planctomycetota bacterium]
MKQFYLALVMFAWSAGAPAYAVESIFITGSAIDIGSLPGAAPSAALLYFATDSADIFLDLRPDESFVALALQALNDTPGTWSGMLLELDGGTFATAPASLLGGPSASLLSADTALLNDTAMPGGAFFLSVSIAASQDPVVLTSTPLAIPEPTTLAVFVPVMAALLGRRMGRG